MPGTDGKQSGDDTFNQGHCRILRINYGASEEFADGRERSVGTGKAE
jgi:hypothetical protein